MRKLQKPIGLYILTIFYFSSLGVLPFAGNFLQIRNSEESVPFAIVFVWLALPVFTAASAVWALTGDNNGRYALLIFVSLNVLWFFFNILNVMAYESADAKQNIHLVTSIVRGAFWLGINWWYLTKKDLVEYFKQQAQLSN